MKIRARLQLLRFSRQHRSWLEIHNGIVYCLDCGAFLKLSQGSHDDLPDA